MNKIGFYLGFFGPIYYFILLLVLGLLWNGYSPISQSMSEIGAVDSSYRHFMNFLGLAAVTKIL